jgi:NADPH-dependent 2,4-dienoyl-CoA reductase/sulfur reductase-like enzyme
VVANTGLLEKTSIAKEPAAGRRRVVIIGAGFAGIAAVYSW